MEYKWREVRKRGVVTTYAERPPVRHSYFPSHRFYPNPRIVGNRDRETHSRNQERGQSWKNEHRYPEENKTVTFFFNNIPEDCSVDFLKWKFGSVQQVREVFCPRKRDLRGRPFGFVRFNKVEDQEKLLLALNKLWIRPYKIRVYKPRFDKELTAQQTEEVGERGKHVRVNRVQGVIPGRKRDEGISFKDVLIGRTQTEPNQPPLPAKIPDVQFQSKE